MKRLFLVSIAACLINLSSFASEKNIPDVLKSFYKTFQNAQKITSDLDDLTGDPSFRNNLRNLVNGLSGLVSSTQQLEQQVEVAQFLEPMAEATNLQTPNMPIMSQMGHTPADTLPNFTADFIDNDKPNLPVVERTAIRKDRKPISNKSAYAEDWYFLVIGNG